MLLTVVGGLEVKEAWEEGITKRHKETSGSDGYAYYLD